MRRGRVEELAASAVPSAVFVAVTANWFSLKLFKHNS